MTPPPPAGLEPAAILALPRETYGEEAAAAETPVAREAGETLAPDAVGTAGGGAEGGGVAGELCARAECAVCLGEFVAGEELRVRIVF